MSEVSAVDVNNGIVTDTNGFEYIYVGDGIYSISSDATTSQFGFAITGNYNGQPIIRSFNDLTWNNPVKTNLQDGFRYNIIDTSGNWDTQFTFTNDYTKIQNTITNPYASDISNAKFWYVMSVENGDTIAVANQRYTVKSYSNIHITDSQYDLNSIVNTMRVNDIQLSYQDLIDNNFEITDLYLTNGDILGYPNTKVIAVGFTKGNSVFSSGSTIIIDPEIENGFDGLTIFTASNISGNHTLSFNEVNASEAFVNITNATEGSDVYDGWDKVKNVTLTNPPTINNYQMRLTVSYDSDMQADFDDLRFADINGTILDYNILDFVASSSATVDVLIPNQDSIIKMYYDNPSASDASTPYNVYELGGWDTFPSSSLNTTTWDSGGTPTVSGGSVSINANSEYILSKTTFGTDVIVEGYGTISGVNYHHFGIADTYDGVPLIQFQYGFPTGGSYNTRSYDIGAEANAISVTAVDHLWAIQRNSTTDIRFLVDDSLKATHTSEIPTTNLKIVLAQAPAGSGGTSTFDYILVRKFLETEPTESFGSEQTNAAGPLGNITVSVIGDSYVFTGNGTATLTPTADISNVTFVANSTTQYDYNVSMSWTEDFVVYTETVENGYANYSVSYTPSENITSGQINATYNQITFSEHDYVGSVTATFNGTPIEAIRNGQTVSIDVTNLNTDTHSFFISIPYNPQPTMIYPDGQTLSFPFPPLNHDVPANWTTTTGIYRYTITTQGGVFVAQDTVTTNSTTFILPAGDYYWYVQGYDDIFDEYSSAANVFNFTVQNDYGILNTTAIVGVVYSQDGETKTPITNAVVTITNDTWSDSIVVGSDGFYSFLDLAGNETYFLAASVEYFDDSGTIIVTTNPNNVTQRDILLTTTTTDYVPHYVKFIVKSLLGTKYQDVNINIYKGNTAAGVVFRSGVTGADGSATFRLDQNQQYTITFISETLGISETKTLYPVDNEYPIIVFRTNMVPDDRDQDDILFGAYGQSINLTHGYINISFNDTSGTTTSANAYIKDTNLTTLYSFSTTNSSATWSQIVEGGNATYIVEFDLQNTVLDDTLEITRTIKFSDVVNFDLGFDEGWKYIFVSSAILILILLLASKLNAEIMTGVTILAAWLLTFLGWTTAGLTTSQSITVGLMLLFGTILSFGAIIRRGEREL